MKQHPHRHHIAQGLPVVLLFLLAACPDDGDDDGAEPSFPADYAASYTEVRECRRSGGEHELNFFRVLADPAALASYNDRATPFPAGSVVLKEEYDFSDTTCAGPIVRFSAMIKDETAGAALLGWRWEGVISDRVVIESNASRCYGCHEGCGGPPDGYDGTCTVP